MSPSSSIFPSTYPTISQRPSISIVPSQVPTIPFSYSITFTYTIGFSNSTVHQNVLNGNRADIYAVVSDAILSLLNSSTITLPVQQESGLLFDLRKMIIVRNQESFAANDMTVQNVKEEASICPSDFILSTDCIQIVTDVLLESSSEYDIEVAERAVREPIKSSMVDTNFINQLGKEEIKEIKYVQDGDATENQILLTNIGTVVTGAIILAAVAFILLIACLVGRFNARRGRRLSEENEQQLEDDDDDEVEHIRSSSIFDDESIESDVITSSEKNDLSVVSSLDYFDLESGKTALQNNLDPIDNLSFNTPAGLMSYDDASTKPEPKDDGSDLDSDAYRNIWKGDSESQNDVDDDSQQEEQKVKAGTETAKQSNNEDDDNNQLPAEPPSINVSHDLSDDVSRMTANDNDDNDQKNDNDNKSSSSSSSSKSKSSSNNNNYSKEKSTTISSSSSQYVVEDKQQELFEMEHLNQGEDLNLSEVEKKRVNQIEKLITKKDWAGIESKAITFELVTDEEDGFAGGADNNNNDQERDSDESSSEYDPQLMGRLDNAVHAGDWAAVSSIAITLNGDNGNDDDDDNGDFNDNINEAS